MRLGTQIYRAHWTAVPELLLILMGAAAFAIAAVAVFVRVFRAEVAEREAARNNRDRGAPPWAQQ